MCWQSSVQCTIQATATNQKNSPSVTLLNQRMQARTSPCKTLADIRQATSVEATGRQLNHTLARQSLNQARRVLVTFCVITIRIVDDIDIIIVIRVVVVVAVVTVTGHAVFLVAPAVQGACRSHRDRVPRAAGNLRHVESDQSLHALGRAGPGFVAVPELAVHAASPSPARTAELHRTKLMERTNEYKQREEYHTSRKQGKQLRYCVPRSIRAAQLFLLPRPRHTPACSLHSFMHAFIQILVIIQ